MKVSIETVSGIEVLKVEIPLSPRASKSGKNLTIATTNGNHIVPGLEYHGAPVCLGVNAYVDPNAGQK